MVDQACCYECGAILDLKTFVIIHKRDCPHQDVVRGSGIDKSVSMVPKQDKKMIFYENWKILYPGLIDNPYFQPVYDPELKFAKQAMGRNWMFDFAWVDSFVAVEIDGGNRLATIGRNGKPVAVGRHTLMSDYEKRNAAVSLGWILFCFTVEMVKNDPVTCCNIVYRKICEVINEKKPAI